VIECTRGPLQENAPGRQIPYITPKLQGTPDFYSKIYMTCVKSDQGELEEQRLRKVATDRRTRGVDDIDRILFLFVLDR
jgi:hypothetical protein